DRIYLFFAFCYLAQGMSGIIYEPLAYLLKDVLHLGSAQAAAFVWWMTLPMLIKPVFGVLTDMLPLGGRRRRPHMALACLIWGGALAALAWERRFPYYTLLVLLACVNVGLVLGDIVCDAVMVEQGQLAGKTGPYQAVQIGILYATIVVTGLGGGWLSAHASARQVFALAAVFPALALFSIVWMREPVAPAAARQVRLALGRVAVSRRFWAVAGLIFLWSFSPFLGTAQFYYESETLKLGPVLIGWIDTIGGLAGAIGALAYGRLIGVWSLRQWLRACVWGGAALALLYLGFSGPVSAAVVTAVAGLAGVGFRLALMDLAARACPRGAEAICFAAFMAVFNLAAAASNLVGGWLLERLGGVLSPAGCFEALVVIGALCTLACRPLLAPALEGVPDAAPSELAIAQA
ncbi:MAG: hypothetical protein KGK30_09460, partial [Elusimicrobia bacterium]|nr:hypothetical protein [Elusimicrobiota bacterium]